MYTKVELYAYAEGYHDGRNDYVEDNGFTDDEIAQCATMYAEGYKNGVEDRTEQDERG